MRIFRFIFLIPALLCTTGTVADQACWEIKNACNDKNSCVLSAKTIDEHSVTTKYYFRCGGQGGCKPQTITRSNADMPTMYTYNECTSNGWKQIPDIKSYIRANINKIRNCGDNEASTRNVRYIVEAREISDEYDFIMEQHKTYALNSDICKKPKTDAGTVNKTEPVKAVEKPKSNATPDQPKQTEQKPGETATTETPESKTETPVTAASTPGSTEQPKPNTEKAAPVTTPTPAGKNFTITGTVVDDTNSPIPQVNIVVVGDETHGVAADDDGRYTINGLSADSKLKFSSIGFEPVEKTVANLNDNPNVVLKETAVGLQEVTISPCADDEKFENGKCVKIKTAEPAKEPVVEPAVATELPVSAPKPTPEELEKRLTESQDALDAARDKENSLANKLLTGASTAATGIGAMQAASAIAEQRADRNAERDMRQYITTMQCEYGDGKIINLGNTDVTLPGGNELLEYYSEYKSLADNLKTTKSALGLRSGIESEVLYDRAQSGLYQYATAERGTGGEISLYRALTDTEGADAVRWAEQKESTAKQLKTGAGVAVGGVATGLVGDAAINTDMIKNIKDAFKK